MRFKKVCLAMMLMAACFSFTGCGSEKKPDASQEQNVDKDADKVDEPEAFEEEPEVEEILDE